MRTDLLTIWISERRTSTRSAFVSMVMLINMTPDPDTLPLSTLP
ncbi:hypothetical protein [Streptomyces sp. NBC_00893]|nr:hypothetical protein [Streptomyces sp. NBC_00893]MCX4851290.1 hypothetical protein [Streptomyces sp. NBC_00893]